MTEHLESSFEERVAEQPSIDAPANHHSRADLPFVVPRLPAAGHAGHGAHAGQGETPGQGGQSDMEKMQSELQKLSPADRASAEKQHVCPVTGKMLGTMGPPQKIDVRGQQVWICCSGCRDELLNNAEKYLTKPPAP